MILLMLPEDPTILRHAANLLESVQEAQAEYNEFIAIHGSFCEASQDPVVLGDNDDIHDAEEIEIEAIRDPDYSAMSINDAIGICLKIHGSLTRPQIAEITGLTVRDINRAINWKTTYNPNGEHGFNGALNAPYLLVGGHFGKGSWTNPATVIPNTEGNRERYVS